MTITLSLTAVATGMLIIAALLMIDYIWRAARAVLGCFGIGFFLCIAMLINPSHTQTRRL